MATGVKEALEFVQLNSDIVRHVLLRVEKDLLGTAGNTEKPGRAVDAMQPSPRLTVAVRRAIGRDAFLQARLRPDGGDASRLQRLRVYKGLDCVVEEIRRVSQNVRIREGTVPPVVLLYAGYLCVQHCRFGGTCVCIPHGGRMRTRLRYGVAGYVWIRVGLFYGGSLWMYIRVHTRLY